MVINKKEYSLAFDNKALFEFGELCGFETYSDTLDIFHEFAKVADGAKLKIDLADKLGKLCFVCLKVGNKSLDLTERDVFNHMIENPGFMGEALSMALLSFSRTYPENEGVAQEEEVEKKK
jgi:hypothetical protein